MPELTEQLHQLAATLQLQVQESKVLPAEAGKIVINIFVTNVGSIGEVQVSNNTVGQGFINTDSGHVENVAFNNTYGQNVDLNALIPELTKLRNAISAQPSSLDRDSALGQVASAEKAAAKGDRSKMMEYLKEAGSWTLEVAKSIGTSVAEAALKAALGLS